MGSLGTKALAAQFHHLQLVSPSNHTPRQEAHSLLTAMLGKPCPYPTLVNLHDLEMAGNFYLVYSAPDALGQEQSQSRK